MAYYLVKARLQPEHRAELEAWMASGRIAALNPFGPTLARSLQEARLDPATGQATWEELCYCSPPLKEERAEVLDRFFQALEVERVAPGEGWRRVAHLPRLWPEETA